MVMHRQGVLLFVAERGRLFCRLKLYEWRIVRPKERTKPNAF